MNSNETGSIDFIDASLAEQPRRTFSRVKFLELYEQAVTSANERVELIIRAHRKMDFAEIENHAQALSGLSRNFGFTKLQESIVRVVNDAESHDNELLSASVSDLEKMSRATFEKLREVVPQAPKWLWNKNPVYRT